MPILDVTTTTDGRTWTVTLQVAEYQFDEPACVADLRAALLKLLAIVEQSGEPQTRMLAAFRAFEAALGEHRDHAAVLNQAATRTYDEHTGKLLARTIVELEREIAAELREEQGRPGITLTSSWDAKSEVLQRVKGVLLGLRDEFGKPV